MKTKEEIEQLADKYSALGQDAGLTHRESKLENIAYRRGYEHCQEDIADKKYTEEDLHTILRLRKEWYSHTDKNVVRDYINSLNKQD